MKTWKRWTISDLERLKELRWSGWSARRIAQELKRSLYSIRSVLDDRKIPRPALGYRKLTGTNGRGRYRPRKKRAWE